MNTDRDKPYPDGWQKNFWARADLERSFTELDGYEHFFADTMRGFIRSVQLRYADAWEFFDRAYENAVKAEETIPNLIRQFLLNIHCFDNALLEAPLNTDNANLPGLWIPELPDRILEEYPEVKVVINMRRNSEGVLRLHLGEYDASAEIFEKLIDDNPTTRPDNLSWYYLGLAAAQQGLGLKEESRRNLENAAFSIQTGGELLNRGRAATVLQAWYTFLGEHQEASGWEDFLGRLECPRATRDLFQRRAAIVLERSTQHAGLLVL